MRGKIDNFWIESASLTMVRAIHNTNSVLWSIKSRWLNFLYNFINLDRLITHIYREGNTCADVLASLILKNRHNTWYNHVVKDAWEDFFNKFDFLKPRLMSF